MINWAPWATASEAARWPPSVVPASSLTMIWTSAPGKSFSASSAALRSCPAIWADWPPADFGRISAMRTDPVPITSPLAGMAPPGVGSAKPPPLPPGKVLPQAARVSVETPVIATVRNRRRAAREGALRGKEEHLFSDDAATRRTGPFGSDFVLPGATSQNPASRIPPRPLSET